MSDPKTVTAVVAIGVLGLCMCFQLVFLFATYLKSDKKAARVRKSTRARKKPEHLEDHVLPEMKKKVRPFSVGRTVGRSVGRWCVARASVSSSRDASPPARGFFLPRGRGWAGRWTPTSQRGIHFSCLCFCSASALSPSRVPVFPFCLRMFSLFPFVSVFFFPPNSFADADEGCAQDTQVGGEEARGSGGRSPLAHSPFVTPGAHPG